MSPTSRFAAVAPQTRGIRLRGTVAGGLAVLTLSLIHI